MEATILDLRYHMKNILNALDRNEQVTILYHGKIKGVIYPFPKKSECRVQDHPLFSSDKKTKLSVEEQMEKLRGDRYGDL